MAGSQRLKRMADTVQRELSELIRQELKDPRLGGLVTISAVKVSPDLGYAEVYVTVMGRELGDEQSEAAKRKKRCSEAFCRRVDESHLLRLVVSKFALLRYQAFASVRLLFCL